MSEIQVLHREALDMLKETSRTFFIPINQLAPGLKEAVASAYLCMRAIDEIEDHPQLQCNSKSDLLLSISQILQKPFPNGELSALLQPYKDFLPEVTLRLGDWIRLCPPLIVEKVLKSTSTMAMGMAEWVKKDWKINNEEDLDDYTYYVAGLVGVMLTDIWKWYDNTDTEKHLAISFGRGLQAVNILRNHSEDLSRGVSFFPAGWKLDDMFEYARKNLSMANEYIKDIKTDTIHNFCAIPLALAHATLDALTAGKEKMSRSDVTEVVSRVISK